MCGKPSGTGLSQMGTGFQLLAKTRFCVLLLGTGLSLSGNRFPRSKFKYSAVTFSRNRVVPGRNRFLLNQCVFPLYVFIQTKIYSQTLNIALVDHFILFLKGVNTYINTINFRFKSHLFHYNLPSFLSYIIS